MLALLLALLIEEPPQVAAVRTVAKLLAEKNWAKVYADHSHPHVQKQMTAAEFEATLTGPKGKPMIDVFSDVLKAVDEKAGPDVLLAQPQKDVDEYEFILVKVKALPNRMGRQWHLELKLDGGVWKILDTD